MCSNLNGTFNGVDGVAVSSTTLRRGGKHQSIVQKVVIQASLNIVTNKYLNIIV